MSNALLQFRTLYLQAIARAWEDSSFYSDLVTDVEGSPDYGTGAYGGDKLSLIYSTFTSMNSPWEHLEVKIIKRFSDNGGSISNPGTQWSTQSDLEWIGPNGFFIVNIPQSPAKKEDQAEALAAYYHLFPTFIGPHISSSESLPLQTNANTDYMATVPPPVSEGDSFQERLLNFGEVTHRVISLAWTDENFASAITAPQLNNASDILVTHFGYHTPWDFNILFRQPSGFQWYSNESKNKGYLSIPKNVVVFNFPEKPATGVSLPIALTEDNLKGSNYPFTCSWNLKLIFLKGEQYHLIGSRYALPNHRFRSSCVRTL